jgi:enterochelin esterase family protein
MNRAALFCVSLASMSVPLVEGGCVSPEGARSPPPVEPGRALADRRVTFRFEAPGAKQVSLALEGSAPEPMVRDDRGIWSVTTGPLEPDLYAYSFVVDGIRAIDPANPLLKPSLISTENMVHVRGSAPSPWDVADVPRGRLHHHFYTSAVVGDERDFHVYTPPGYDASGGRRYPVLYLLHGFSDDTGAWSAVGRAHVIFDNLIAQGKVKPMIVVMPLGYGAPEILAGGFAGFGKDRDLMRRNFDRFGQALLGEVRPQVDAAYRTVEDRDGRAIAGLSMGGAEALLTGLGHLEQFAWIGAFSSGGLTDDFVAQFSGLDRGANARLRLLWIACGTDDALIEINRKLRDWLRSRGVDHAGVETPGGHTWAVWRRNLVAFASLLFAGPS